MAIAAPSHAEIRSDAAYSLPDFQRITGLGAKAIRKARREGLTVTRCGRRSYILGQSWINYLADKAGAAK
jgi:hypothetical protein